MEITKEEFEPLELLKQIYKTLSKRPQFTQQLSAIHLPTFIAPQNQPHPGENVDIGLFQASDALLEVAYLIHASLRVPNHNINNKGVEEKNETRQRELELLLGRLYAEKRFQDAKELEMNGRFKRVLEKEIRKQMDTTKELERRIEVLSQEKKALEARLTAYDKLIMATSISFDGEMVNREPAQNFGEERESQVFSLIQDSVHQLDQSNNNSEIKQEEIKEEESKQEEQEEEEEEEIKQDLVQEEQTKKEEEMNRVSQEVQTEEENLPKTDQQTSTLEMNSSSISPFSMVQENQLNEEQEKQEVGEWTVQLNQIHLVQQPSLPKILENHNATTLSSMSILVQGFEQKLVTLVDEIKQNVEKEHLERAEQFQDLSSSVSQLQGEIKQGTVEAFGKSIEVLENRISENFDELKAHFDTVIKETLTSRNSNAASGMVQQLTEKLEQEKLQAIEIEEKRKRQLTTVLELVEKLEGALQKHTERTADLTKFKAIQKKLSVAIQEIQRIKSQHNEAVSRDAPQTETLISQLTNEINEAKKFQSQFASTCVKAYSLIIYLFMVLAKQAKLIHESGTVPVSLPAFMNQPWSFAPAISEEGAYENLCQMIDTVEKESPLLAVTLEDQLQTLMSIFA